MKCRDADKSRWLGSTQGETATDKGGLALAGGVTVTVRVCVWVCACVDARYVHGSSAQTDGQW